MTMLEQLRQWQDEINALPPYPRCIIASHRVPYGRAPRMWNTRGELIVYANRGEIADLPRAKPKPPDPFSSMPLFGIPIHFE